MLSCSLNNYDKLRFPCLITKGEKHFYFNLTNLALHLQGGNDYTIICVQGFWYGVEKMNHR